MLLTGFVAGGVDGAVDSAVELFRRDWDLWLPVRLALERRSNGILAGRTTPVNPIAGGLESGRH